MHHRLSSQMYGSFSGVKVSVSWNRIVDAMIEFPGGDPAKLASGMCVKLIAEYVGLLGFIALALSDKTVCEMWHKAPGPAPVESRG